MIGDGSILDWIQRGPTEYPGYIMKTLDFLNYLKFQNFLEFIKKNVFLLESKESTTKDLEIHKRARNS